MLCYSGILSFFSELLVVPQKVGEVLSTEKFEVRSVTEGVLSTEKWKVKSASRVALITVPR